MRSRAATVPVLTAAVLALTLIAAACTAPAPPLGTPTLPSNGATPTSPPAAPVTPGTVVPTLPPFDGPVPAEAMAALVEETAALAQATVGDVNIVRAEAVTWRDGSLGCPEEGMTYIQVLVDGYWVVLEAGGQTYDWRIGEGGLPRLCPEGQGEPPFEGLPD